MTCVFSFLFLCLGWLVSLLHQHRQAVPRQITIFCSKLVCQIGLMIISMYFVILNMKKCHFGRIMGLRLNSEQILHLMDQDGRVTLQFSKFFQTQTLSNLLRDSSNAQNAQKHAKSGDRFFLCLSETGGCGNVGKQCQQDEPNHS